LFPATVSAMRTASKPFASTATLRVASTLEPSSTTQNSLRSTQSGKLWPASTLHRESHSSRVWRPLEGTLRNDSHRACSGLVTTASAWRYFRRKHPSESVLGIGIGIGISGRRERVKRFDREFLISSSLGIGATIEVVLPLIHRKAQSDGRARSSIARHPFHHCTLPPSLPIWLSDTVPARQFLSPRGPL
jgi:hypothetical protein